MWVQGRAMYSKCEHPRQGHESVGGSGNTGGKRGTAGGGAGHVGMGGGGSGANAGNTGGGPGGKGTPRKGGVSA